MGVFGVLGGFSFDCFFSLKSCFMSLNLPLGPIGISTSHF